MRRSCDEKVTERLRAIDNMKEVFYNPIFDSCKEVTSRRACVFKASGFLSEIKWLP